MQYSSASLFQKITAISFVLILSLFYACDLFNLSVPDYIARNINTAEGTDFQFVTETNGTAGVFYLIKPNQATELDILLRNPQKFDLEPILEFLNGTDTWTGTNPLHNSNVYITARNTGDYSKIRITIGADGGFPVLGTELPRMRLKLKNNELRRVYETPYVLPLMKCAENNTGGGSDPGDPGDPDPPPGEDPGDPLLAPAIVAVVPVNVTDSNSQEFQIYWYPASGGGTIENVYMEINGETKPIVIGTGNGDAESPYINSINLNSPVSVITPLKLTVTYEDGTGSITEYPETVQLPIYVKEDGGSYGITEEYASNLSNVFNNNNNVLSRYSNIKIIVSGNITNAESYTIALGKTVVIEPSSTGVGMTIKKSVSQGTLFTVESGGKLTIKGNGTNTLTLKGLPENNVSLIFVSGELIMETGAVITENNNNYNTINNGGGVHIGAGGKFTMRGGEIYNNSAVYGGGVFISNLEGGGTFIMEGGIIGTTEGEVTDPGNKGNTAENGGGVFIGDGTFTMKGSSVIAQNKANNSVGGGGGVYAQRGRFEMVSGTIGGGSDAGSDGNWALGNGGGLYLTGNAQLNRVNETTTIERNIIGITSVINNVYQP